MRSLLSLIVLVFFTTQSFLIATHLHDLPKNFAPLFSTATASSQPDAKTPVSADQCLLCQEYVRGGVYVLPATIAALPPHAAVSLLPFVLAPIELARIVSHDWLGRAPPSHL